VSSSWEETNTKAVKSFLTISSPTLCQCHIQHKFYILKEYLSPWGGCPCQLKKHYPSDCELMDDNGSELACSGGFHGGPLVPSLSSALIIHQTSVPALEASVVGPLLPSLYAVRLCSYPGPLWHPPSLLLDASVSGFRPFLFFNYFFSWEESEINDKFFNWLLKYWKASFLKNELKTKNLI
jgi:hypothetical protein